VIAVDTADDVFH